MKTINRNYIIFSIILILLTACRPQCIQNPQDDGNYPSGSIMVRYKDNNGSDVSKVIEKGTSGSANELFIAKGTNYSIHFTGNDNSGIKEITVEKITLNNDSEMDQIADENNWLKQSFDCAIQIQTISKSVSSHDDKIIIYLISVTDWFGYENENGVAIWIVPT